MLKFDWLWIMLVCAAMSSVFFLGCSSEAPPPQTIEIKVQMEQPYECPDVITTLRDLDRC